MPNRPRSDAAMRLARGERITLLRKHFDLNVDECARAGGVPHSLWSNMERGKIGWQSDRPRLACMAVFGFNFEQFLSYIEGRMPIDQAIAIARSRATTVKSQRADESERQERLENVLGLIDRELAPGIRDAARRALLAKILEMPKKEAVDRLTELNLGLWRSIERAGRGSGKFQRP